jgi:glycosyltransferase 2 family protein
LAPQSKRTRQVAVVLVKVSVSLAICFALVSKVGVQPLINTMSSVRPTSFLAAVGFYLVAMYLSSVRWRIFIPLKTGTRNLYALYMIGSFFNIFLPGIVGGDAVKAYYLGRHLKSLRDECDGQSVDKATSQLNENALALASVFMDRYIGFCALLVINLFAFAAGFSYVAGTSLKWLIPLIFIAFVCASILFFVLKLGSGFTFVNKVYQYFDFYRSKARVLVETFLYSVVVQLLGILSVYVLSRGLSIEVPFLPLLVFVPIAITASLIPLSISGLGFREGAFVVLFATVGVPSELSMTLSLLWFLSMVAGSMWGLVEYLRVKRLMGKVPVPEENPDAGRGHSESR